MNDAEFSSFCEQIILNPAFERLMKALEDSYVNQAVYASYEDDKKRQFYLTKVQAVRDFKQDCLAHADNKPVDEDGSE